MGTETGSARIAELEEKLRVLTIQNNARGVLLHGHREMGWDRRAERLARQQLDSQRNANARLTDEVERLENENARLRIAFHDAIRRPLGVKPDSGAEFYDRRLADEAEARRPRC